VRTDVLGVPLVLALLVGAAPDAPAEPPEPTLVIDVAVDG
jgi:hypothetical protein